MLAKISAPPKTQALQSKTFRSPPLDGSLTLPEIYDWHYSHTPHHRLFIFSDSNNDIRTIYWPEAVRSIYNGVRFLQKKVDWQTESDVRPIIAILGATDTITYFTMIMAIMRCGYTVFPISPRNSPPAVAHLIKAVGIQYILVGNETSMTDLANESLLVLKNNYNMQVVHPKLIAMPCFEDLYRDTGDNFETLPSVRKEPNDIIAYLHSSGSTAFPKPIPITNLRFIELALNPYFGERDLTDQVLSLHTMPMFHGMGVIQCSWTAACGLVLSAFEPKSPAQIPSPDNLFHAAVATQSDVIFCVPAIIEAWSRNPEYVKWLATRGGVLYGGGPLNKAAGDYMTSQGVSIFILYGATEGGVMSPILPASPGYDWEYFRFPDLVKAEMVLYTENIYELVMVANEYCHPSVINTQVDGVDAYATSDLLMAHPTKPGYWKVYGRTDDQIMHNTGEKTNPGPLENILNQDPHVQSSVMFGRGKFQAGVLIDPKPAFKFDPSDETALESFRNKIWPTIQKMNQFAPQHSRLFKEMILVAKPSKPFEYTAKNTARRQAILKNYVDEVEAVYDAVERTTQTSIPVPQEWDIVSATNFARAVVGSVLVHQVKDGDDIFQHGCDSLQATWIRNTLTRALRDSIQLDTRKNANNFVYDYPTISALATFLVAHIHGNQAHKSTNEAKQKAMEDMVVRYTANLPAHTPGTGPFPDHKIVLLTGSTGGMGAFVLSALVADDDVEHVYCLNRPSKDGTATLLERQRTSLLDKALPLNILESPKITLLEGRLDETYWSLERTVYDMMHESVTHIIHNAWPVDFNLSLASFEANVRGLRSLIDFSLSSPHYCPPALIYTSTIGVFQNPKSIVENLPELPVGVRVAIGSGYSESKWVSEQILSAASSTTSLKTVIVRVGQISGGPNGVWSTKEWLPALVQSAKFVSCLPNVGKDVSWLPVHIAGRSLVDIMNAPESTIVHLVNPTPTPWSTLAKAISSELSVPLVPYHEWLSKLEHLALAQRGDTATNLNSAAALRLLNFYRSIGIKMDETGEGLCEAFGLPRLSTENAVKASSALANSKQLSCMDATLWVSYWRAVDFM